MGRRAANRVRLRYLKEGDSSEDIGVDRRIILKWEFKQMGSEIVGCISLVQYSDRWRAGVNAVMKLCFSLCAPYFITG